MRLCGTDRHGAYMAASMLKKQHILKAFVISIGFVILLSLSFYAMALREPMYAEFTWHIKGAVLDDTGNLVSGAKVTVGGFGRVTAINKIFSTPPRNVRISVLTDNAGKFQLDFKASMCWIDIEKHGYETTRRMFQRSTTKPDDTNQEWSVHLAKEVKVESP
jgi:hypothetical protein